MPHIAIILNEASRHGFARMGDLDAALRRANLDARIMAVDPASIDAAAERAAEGSAVVVAAGGDGTVSATASAVLRTGSTLGVLPLGTLNHFARDAGIPMDLNKAVKVIAEGHAHAVDVGEINGRTFLNNASFGVYPRLVWERELAQRSGRGKWTAFALGLMRTWRRYPTLVARTTVDGEPFVQHTPFLVVANGEYRFEGLRLGSRDTLNAEQLWVYVAPECGQFEILALPFRALAGRLKPEAKFQASSAHQIVIETLRPRRAQVAIDGELVALPPPFRCSVRPGALRLLVPEPTLA
jgi:diacylglycerol kinase family enzyme